MSKHTAGVDVPDDVVEPKGFILHGNPDRTANIGPRPSESLAATTSDGVCNDALSGPLAVTNTPVCTLGSQSLVTALALEAKPPPADHNIRGGGKSGVA